MDVPRPAKSGEFSEVMAFIDRVFRPGQPGRLIMHRQYPHLYRDEPAHLARSLILRDQGEIVGHLAIHPVLLRLDGATVRAGGIGGVAAAPERRGQGIMTALLEAAGERMRQQGYPLSVLGGDRRRYGWFGWENAGLRNTFSLTPRYLGRPTATERRLLIRPLRLDLATRRRILALDRVRPFGTERRAAELAPRFQRTSRDAWECRVGRCFAYVVLGGHAHQARPYERVDEVGGDPELVRSMIRVLMARYRCPHLRATTGANPGDVALFRPVSGQWERGTDGMVRIVDLPLLLEQLAPVLRRRAQRLHRNGTLHLSMIDSGQQGTLTLGPGPVHRLRLSDREMVALFFGLHPVGEAFTGTAAARLDGLLPLPLFIPPLDHV